MKAIHQPSTRPIALKIARAQFTIAILALALACGIAQARLGETLEQCVARYGQPVPSQIPDTTVFLKAPLFIGCQFGDDGLCHTIIFRNVEENVLDIPQELTDAQLQALLTANGGGVAWTPAPSLTSRDWQTDTLAATYDIADRILVIMTKAAALRAGEEKARKEKEALQGF